MKQICFFARRVLFSSAAFCCLPWHKWDSPGTWVHVCVGLDFNVLLKGWLLSPKIYHLLDQNDGWEPRNSIGICLSWSRMNGLEIHQQCVFLTSPLTRQMRVISWFIAGQQSALRMIFKWEGDDFICIPIGRVNLLASGYDFEGVNIA